MRFWIRTTVLLALIFSTAVAASADGPYPAGPAPVAAEVEGIWQATDEDNPLTQDMSENALELLELIRTGKIPLELDLTGWEPPMPTTLQEALWHLRYNQDATNILFRNHNAIDFGADTPATVDAALRSLATKKPTAASVTFGAGNVVHWGLDNPETVKAAFDILAGRVAALEARVEALENP